MAGAERGKKLGFPDIFKKKMEDVVVEKGLYQYQRKVQCERKLKKRKPHETCG
jgi:hypothetical protein